MSVFIEDGYTCNGYIKSLERVHDEFRFQYRPATVLERADTIQKTTLTKDTQKNEKIMAVAIAKHLVGWCDDRDITPQNVLKLPPNVFNRLASIVIYGTEGGDLDPDAPTDDSKDIDRELEAAFSDDPSATAQENDRKN